MAAESSLDCFLKLDGIDGESQDSKHKNEIEVDTYSLRVDQQGSAHTGGGAGSGLSEHGDIRFTKLTDKASAKLLQASSSGEHIKKAVLTCRKAGKDQQDFLTYTFSDVLISHYQMGSPKAGQLPKDQFDLNFGKIEIEYKEQKSDGTLGGSVKGGWDIKARKKA